LRVTILVITVTLFGCVGTPETDGEPVAVAQDALDASWAAPAPALEPRATVERAPSRMPMHPALPLTRGALVLAQIAACRNPGGQSGLANAGAMRCMAAVLSAGH